MKILKQIRIVLTVLVLLGSTTTQQATQEIIISLTAGSSKSVDIPLRVEGHQKYELTAFKHQTSQIVSFPCSMQTTQSSKFSRMGQLEHEWTTFIKDDFWQGGSLWDAIVSGNRILCVFEGGEVSEFSTRGIDTTYKPFQKITTVKPFEGKNIPFGKLLSFEEPSGVFHTIYFSTQGCYHIRKDGSWQKMLGYQGQQFQQAKSSQKYIYVGDRSRLTKYLIDIAAMKVSKEQQMNVVFTQNGKTYPLWISDFYIDEINSRIFLIDSYEGVKYIQIQQKTHLEAKHLIPSQRCQNILIVNQLIFISCSHLIIANSTNLKILKQVPYSFHVTHLFYQKGYLTVLGDNQYAIYSVLFDTNNALKVQFVFKGNLPDRNYDQLFYLNSSKYFVLFSKKGMEYGRITEKKERLECEFLRVAGKSNFDSLTGLSTAILKVQGRCPEDNKNFDKECTSQFAVKVTIYDIKSYKWIVWIILSVLALIPLSVGSYRLYKLRNKKKLLLYDRLNEQTIVTSENSSNIEKDYKDVEQCQPEIQMPQVFIN